MEQSPTGQVAAPVASEEPTTQTQQPQNPAESNQETSSGGNTQGSVSDGTANNQATGEKQTSQTGGDTQTDDGLANFAKSQGFDLDTAGDDVKRALKIAHDNQKAFRSNTSQKITDVVKPGKDADANARIAHLEYERETDKFFDGKDRSLESKMIQVLQEKREKYGDTYAAALSQDLDSLYQLAGGSQASAPVDVEAIRREERESINKQMSSGTPTAAATTGQTSQPQKVTQEWIANEYDPRNPEHRQLVDDFYSGK